MNTQEKVRRYIVESFLGDTEAEAFRDEDDLLTILDSLQILRMVVEFERSFSIKIDNSQLTAENLGSVEKVAALIERHLS